MDWDRSKERKAGKALGIGGSIYAIVFIVVWCGIAAAIGAWFMLIFGIPILGFSIFRLAVMIRKSKEKPEDPWEQAYPPPQNVPSDPGREEGYCPYCGERVEGRFTFCPNCGRRLS